MPRAALLETMEEVKRQLGITDPVLYSAVKAANGMMGLAADGTLPQQVHKLAAALGLSRHTVQAQQARDELRVPVARRVVAVQLRRFQRHASMQCEFGDMGV